MTNTPFLSEQAEDARLSGEGVLALLEEWSPLLGWIHLK